MKGVKRPLFSNLVSHKHTLDKSSDFKARPIICRVKSYMMRRIVGERSMSAKTRELTGLMVVLKPVRVITPVQLPLSLSIFQNWGPAEYW